MIRSRLLISLTSTLCLVTGAGHSHHIGLLEGVVADGGRGNLAGNGHNRDAVHVGRRQGRRQIRRPRAAGDDDRADLSSGAGIAVSGMAGPLLMPGYDELQRRLVQGVKGRPESLRRSSRTRPLPPDRPACPCRRRAPVLPGCGRRRRCSLKIRRRLDLRLRGPWFSSFPIGCHGSPPGHRRHPVGRA